MEHRAKVVVAGAGIGGLTAAIALRRAGSEVAVFERTADLWEVGAGLLLAANAQKALGKLGLAEEAARLGTPASAGEIRSRRVGMVGQLENPLLCRLRDWAVAFVPPKTQPGQLEEVVGYEV